MVSFNLFDIDENVDTYKSFYLKNKIFLFSNQDFARARFLHSLRINVYIPPLLYLCKSNIKYRCCMMLDNQEEKYQFIFYFFSDNIEA